MGKKVLVVDDEKLIVKGIRFSLEQDGMDVDCAYDGEEAYNLAKQNAYDMVLLDVMLPKMDGFEVCQAIREFSDTFKEGQDFEFVKYKLSQVLEVNPEQIVKLFL